MSHEESTNRQVKGVSTSTAIIIAGIIIAAAIILPRFSGLPEETNVASVDVAANSTTQLVNQISSEDFITGAKKPKVTIVEFSDFGCSFCARFHPTLQQIVDEYPDDVAWVYRHLPYRNKDAAIAAECVGQKLGDEAFWTYTTNLFAAYPNIDEVMLSSQAELLGLSTEDFNACIQDSEIESAVSADAAEAQLLGASGTPFSLLVTDDGRTFPLRGAVAYEQVQQIIDVLIK